MKTPNRIVSIEITDDGKNVAFYFDGEEGALRAKDFPRESTVWEDLKRIEDAIYWFNSTSDAVHGRGVTLSD